MKCLRLALAKVFFLLLFLIAPAQGGMLPYSTVQQMCFGADLILAGKHVGNGNVRVERVFYTSSVKTDAMNTLKVPSIPKHSKIINQVFLRRKDVVPITTDHLVLFLRHTKGGAFEPIGTIGKGSQGLFWYDDKTCYGYQQIMNPGPYVLIRSRSGMSRIPADKKTMWLAIKVGLAQRRRWEAIEAIEDRAKRANQMAAYLLPHTAPEGYAGAVSLRKAIREIGPEAVPALIEVLEKAKPQDKLKTVVLTLYDIGCTYPQALRPAVPALCKLLESPGPNSLYYILSPIKAAGDPRAISYVRPILKHNDKQARAQAARALATMKDQYSFDAITTLIQKPSGPGDRLGYTLELARSLFELDAPRARPIIERVESIPGNAGMHHFISGYKQPRRR